MTGIVPIAPIPLARATGRLLLAPLILFVAGVTAVAGGVQLGDASGVGLVAAGLVVAALSVAMLLMLVSVRLDVEVATLRVRWLGGERRYTLVRGPVTRVALQGSEAARLRPRFGALGWALGRARLRGEENVDLVRLAPTASLILVPTDRGRVGVAPRSEQQLLDALAAAARIQQRLDEVVGRSRAVSPQPHPPAQRMVDLPEPMPELLDPSPADATPASARRMLTGIERTLLEERLAADRAAALLAAESERQAATDAARMAAFVPPASAALPAPGTAAGRSRWGRWPRPARVSAVREERARRLRVARAPRASWAATVSARPRIAAPRISIPAERLVGYALLATPAIAAGAVWLAATIGGRLDLPIEQLRPMALALLAVGPAGALAGLAARAWFPRLLGLVTVTSITALALVGRALIG